MKRPLFIIMLLPLSGMVAQIQGPPLEEELTEPSYSFGLSGSFSMVSPKRLNDGIHFVNTTLDLNVPRINSLLSGSAFLRVWLSPKSYAVLKGEYAGFSRSFQFASPVTSTGSTGTSSFLVTNEKRYQIIPLGIGLGFLPTKSSAFEAEIGFHFALGSIKETGSMESYGSYSSSYDGTGIGFWLTLRPHIRLSDAVSLTPDLTGRLLVIKNLEDQRGRVLRQFEMNFSSISLGASLIVTFR